LDLIEPLVVQGAVSEVELLRLKREVVAIQGEIQSAELAIPRIRSGRDEAKQLLEELELSFRSHAQEGLTEVLADLSQLTARNVALKERVSRTAVRSPVRGTIKQLLIHTVGGVITPGMDLLEIVPLEDTLLIEAQITPANIAFLHPGLEAMVQFTAYDFSIYGGLRAKLEHISADSIIDEKGDSYFQVRVRTDKTNLGSESESLPIIPGMTATVDILTGKKTVLAYLLKPVLRAKSRALRER
jgi:adhesin transport system membrane fusion protein